MKDIGFVMRSKESQNAAILAALESGKVLTPLDALFNYGSLRIGARIYDLRKAGYPVTTTLINIGGKRVAEYSLHKDGNL